MSTVTHTSISDQLLKFKDEFGEELDTCNPNAYDLLVEVIRTGDRTSFEDFVWYHADELDACHPEAFDSLYQIAKDYGIEI